MKISVAITNYNYSRYVGEAIESVLHQTRPADQIVVVDDGSTDNSREVLARFEGRAEIHFGPNRGLPAATNTAIALCAHDIVALLDADDLMFPERLSRIAAVYSSYPDVQWVFNELVHIDRVTGQLMDTTPVQRNFVEGKHDLRGKLRRGQVPMTSPAASALSWRTPFVRSLLPVPDEARLQDVFLTFASIARGVGYVVEEPLTLQGIHADNRYTQKVGRDRDIIRAENAIALAARYEVLGDDLHALGDRLTAAAVWLSRLGLRLPASERGRLAVHIQRLPVSRLARVAIYFARGLLVAVRDLVRRFLARLGFAGKLIVSKISRRCTR